MKIIQILSLTLALGVTIAPHVRAQQGAKPDVQMKAVLDQLAALHPKPISTLTPEEARKQPSPADAVKALLKKQGKSVDPESVAKVENTVIPGPGGDIPIRVYTPKGVGPFPVVVYVHGGGWVLANLDTYDASPRALANLAQAVIVSVEYRHAPEFKFPAAHEDVYTALQYVIKNAEKMNGDPNRVAIAGESAGGNMAAAACLMARDRKGLMPVYQVLVYPVASTTFDTPSYIENAKAKPLNAAMMRWFAHYTLNSPEDSKNPYLSLLLADVSGMPPATVITAQIDPLRSEGREYAENLEKAGVKVAYRNYLGVTHEFFGMGAVVNKARLAEKFAAEGLKSAFVK